MDKKPDSNPAVTTTKTGTTAEPMREAGSLPPQAVQMPTYSPVGGRVPRMAVPMPHSGAGGVLATPASAARSDGPKAVGATPSVMRLEAYPSGRGGMHARAIETVEVAPPSRVLAVSPIGPRPPASPSTGG
jgi:hypothetical protein